MNITKYEHSCLDIDIGGKRLIIDPGVVSVVPDYTNVIAVIVTHVHADHFDIEKLKAIYLQNPEVIIYTVQAVADEVKDTVPQTVVTGGHKASCGPFELEFFGGQHALIHESVPMTDNVAVLVNKALYFPGDSLTVPHVPVHTLAAPITAPWLKIAEAMDYISALKPKQVFPIHDALLSDFGIQVNEQWLQSACDTVGAQYTYLKPGDSTSV